MEFTRTLALSRNWAREAVSQMASGPADKKLFLTYDF
jgi:hypothetical protein